jgi:hypothetical protein
MIKKKFALLFSSYKFPKGQILITTTEYLMQIT